VASFLGKVCGTGVEAKELQTAARLAIRKAVSPEVVEGVTAGGGNDLSALEIVTAITDVDTVMTALVECDDSIVPPTDATALDALTKIAINRAVTVMGPCLDVET